MRPDRKGIKTLYLPLFVTQIKVEMRPDRKGIKTALSSLGASLMMVEMRPDRKGIKTFGLGVHRGFLLG